MNEQIDKLPDEIPSWWRRPGCLLLLASGLLILTAFYAFCLHAPPLRISEETTRITGPLTPDGQIDFLKHLEETTYPPEMKTDDNGFRVFLRTFGDISDTRGNEFYRRQKYEKLGLDPDEKPTMAMPEEPYKIISDYFKQQGEPEPEQARGFCGKPWMIDELPMLEDWLNEIDAPLDAVAEMVRKPVFFPPFLETPEAVQTGNPQSLIDTLLPDVQMFRGLARQYQARANHRIAEGDIDGAIDDTITMLHLARKIANGCVVQHLVGIAIEGVAHTIPLGGNSEHPLSLEQLKRIYGALETLPPPPTSQVAFERERCTALSYLQSLTRRNDSSGGLQDYRVFSIRCNMNIAYRYVNETYDTLTGQRPRSELATYLTRPDPKTMITSFPTTMGRGKLVGRITACLMVPALEAFEEAIRRRECVLNMKHLTLALLMYKAEHGTFPGEDWFERIKPYLGEEPERCLRCPSCSSTHSGTNYALILHEKEPADSDAFLLVELREPMPPEEAFFTPEQALEKFSKRHFPKPIGSHHPGGLNTARRNGALLFFSEAEIEKGEKWRRLLGIEIPEDEKETEDKEPEAVPPGGRP